MANTSEKHKQKKSQKRKDRQARREEKRKEKAKLQHEAEIDELKNEIEKVKTLRLKANKKSLPGFLAKNAEVICQWLRSYMKLFIAADDIGLLNLDRLNEADRQRMVQEYIDIAEFISLVKDLISIQKFPQIEKQLEEKQLEKEIAEMQADLKN